MAKILIIDDDPDIVTAVQMSLEGAGHEVIDARNGEEGLEKIKTERPDMIILDVMMETQDEGFKIAQKLRNPEPSSALAEFSKMPILMLTAVLATTPLGAEEPDVDTLLVDLFVDKPINPDDLIGKVDWILSREKV